MWRLVFFAVLLDRLAKLCTPADLPGEGRIRNAFHRRDARFFKTIHPAGGNSKATFFQLPGEFPTALTDALPDHIGKREMFAVYPFSDQGIKFAGIWRFVCPQNKQSPAVGNDCRMALQGGVGQPAE